MRGHQGVSGFIFSAHLTVQTANGGKKRANYFSAVTIQTVDVAQTTIHHATA